MGFVNVSNYASDSPPALFTHMQQRAVTYFLLISYVKEGCTKKRGGGSLLPLGIMATVTAGAKRVKVENPIDARVHLVI